MSTITISNLRKLYGKITAVDGFSLEIPGASVFGLLGPNGAGKTTTFKCMLGLAHPTSGEILYDGKPLVPATFERIAYIPERSVLYDWMTVAEHVEMTRRAFRAFDPKRAFELLATFNIDRRRRVRALSKGMRTAVMVALAFARNAEILVLDEPTGGLDPINQRHVLSLMINEAAKGNSVIFSSHQIGQVERAAEHIAVMDRGRLVLEGLVDGEPGADRGNLEQHARGLAEVHRVEVVAVDDRRRPCARLRDPHPPRLLVLGLGGPGDVVDGARALQASLCGRGLVQIEASPALAAKLA